MPVLETLEPHGTYEAARTFLNECLQKDGSLFTPDRHIWTATKLEEFHERFVGEADTGSDAFEVKLQRQMDSADDATVQLAAEMLYVQYLAPSGMDGSTKRERIENVLEWMDEPVAIPDDLLPPLELGVADFGAAHAHRAFQIRMLLQFAQTWKELDQPTRKELLGDPWAFKKMVFALDLSRAGVQAEALLHLIHPDSFEPIVSGKSKRAIADAWEDLVETPEDDVDRRLQQIRAALESEYGKGFSFYEPRIRAIWQSEEEPWDEFVHWAKRLFEWDGFEEDEREYKLKVADDLQRVREILEDGEEWIDQLAKVLNVNLVPWRARDHFIKWCRSDPERAARALEQLWEGEAPLIDRIEAFIEQAEEPLYGAKVRLTSVLLMALGATEYPPYAVRAFEAVFDMVGYPRPADEATYGERYRHAMAFLDRILAESRKRGLELRDRLDAQGILWCLAKYDRSFAPVSEWGEEDWHAFKVFRGEAEEMEGDDADEDEPGGPSRDPLGELAGRLLLDRSFLARIRRLLDQKGQVIFYGPPGTGKTYVAKEFARTLTADGGGYRVVQFHPSYAYEDFVEGFRPGKDSGPSGFSLQAGPLKRIANDARENPSDRYVLIIDEINRGNIAKILGELYFLLEYRKEQVELQYSGSGFSLPDNLWIIGTMNTADRSIALMDTALRRRFYFVRFFPQEPPIAGLLGRWLDRHEPDLRWVAELLREANERLDDEHFAIGPSYFMRKDLSEEWVETVWTHSILPYLEERFFGDEEKLADFSLERLRRGVTAADRAGADARIEESARTEDVDEVVDPEIEDPPVD